MTTNFISDIYGSGEAVIEETVYTSIFSEYERVVVNSLITSFGLDFLLFNDKVGGDVDTIHNVRKIDLDPRINYKSKANKKNYEHRGEYKNESYHRVSSFRSAKHNAREKWLNDFHDFPDEYTGGKVGFYGKTKSVPPERKADLDHIVECKGIHDDRGRVLAGLKGEDLANQPDNWAWTNESLNRSMGSWARHENDKFRMEHGHDAPLEMVDAKAYFSDKKNVETWGEDTKERVLKHYEKARKAYDSRINRAYYSSPNFILHSTSAALNSGFKMGLRQCLGLIFAEIWFATKEVLSNSKKTDGSILLGIRTGIITGYERAKTKYKELFSHFIHGAIAGALSSLLTTLCNIFFTTAKRFIKIIRQSWASFVEAVNILLLNPDFLPFGERIRAGAKVIATGASIIAGHMIAEVIANTPLGQMGEIGIICQTFCSVLLTGIMSCTFLIYIDRSKIINDIVAVLNKIPTVDDHIAFYREMSTLLTEYCAKVHEIDIDQFEKETEFINSSLSTIETISDSAELNSYLKDIFNNMNISFPYEDLDSVMTDPNKRLLFNS